MGLRLKNSSGNYVELNAPSSIATDFGLTLPVNDGDANQVLSTNGSGALSFVDRMTAAGPTFFAYLSANQNVSVQTHTKVQLDTENWDTNSNFDNTTNYRFTPTVAGYYQINFRVGTGVGPTRAFATVYKNGTLTLRGSDFTANTAWGSAGAGILYMNGSTDYIELYGWMETTDASRYITGEENVTYMSAALIRPA